MPDSSQFRHRSSRDRLPSDRLYPRQVPARRSPLAGAAVESLVVVGLVTLCVSLVALQALGAFGPTVSAMSFLP